MTYPQNLIDPLAPPQIFHRATISVKDQLKLKLSTNLDIVLIFKSSENVHAAVANTSTNAANVITFLTCITHVINNYFD